MAGFPVYVRNGPVPASITLLPRHVPSVKNGLHAKLSSTRPQEIALTRMVNRYPRTGCLRVMLAESFHLAAKWQSSMNWKENLDVKSVNGLACGASLLSRTSSGTGINVWSVCSERACVVWTHRKVFVLSLLFQVIPPSQSNP